MSGLAACVVALKAFAWPDLDGWRGLPAGCGIGDLQAAWGFRDDGWRGSGYLGDDSRALEWVSATPAGFPDSVRVWLDGDHMVLLDAPILGKPSDLEILATKLGVPAAKLDSYFNVKIEEGEWVYPERGLTLFINPENRVPLRAVAYVPTTLDEYRRSLRPQMRPRAR
jgi:hypothetical protein